MTNLKIGVIGLPGKWSSEVLAQAVMMRTGAPCPVIDIQDVWLDLADNALRYGGLNLCDFDGLLVKKIGSEYSPNSLDRLELLRVAEAAGVRVFSPALNILRLIDRLSCTVTLHNHAIPMPPTCITEHSEKALEMVNRFGSAVFKPLYSTKARGMMVIDAADSETVQRQQISSFQQQHPMMYIQKKIVLPGRDLGMVFLGGEYLGTYARVSQSDTWNTTILSGGKYAAYKPSQELIDLAYAAQKPFNMDFTTVDVAESETGPIVFEVSAFGGFRGAKEGIGIDVATLYVDYAVKTLKGG
ncbi:GAK system ATP-grasp enzyme [Mariprofundus sp. EBB-1]|uniref:GAK system ATP-grasp enzyme n=1 Tax=Mariprofundus sp. EBB-1 TaxID=2650971 RepID=UPI000EF22216|nr:GAK system ATP-grasp enzyme [Mariprofundus sp. EBB-1]RLL51890.1 GAK system ATP-grasp enzyme [Mariprofundus sp. EBB-1]